MTRRGADDAYQQMIDRLPAGVLVHGGDGSVVFANLAAARIAGFEQADDMVGHLIAELLPPPFLRGLRSQLLDGDGPAGRAAVPLCRRDGQRVFVDVSEVPYVSGADVLVQLSFTEVPDQGAEQTTVRRAEALQAEHLDALGRLAGGVAHEMNNVFGAILAEATVRAPGPDGAPADLGLIIDAARRGSAVTADLLGFAQGGLYQRERLGVEALLERSAARARGRVAVSVSILDVVEVEGDARQLDAALDAVLDNAAEATPPGTTVSLLCRRVAVGGPPETDLVAGSYAVIEVDDRGAGPTDEARRRAFEPYFTTHGDARRGLGLSTVYGVVRHHGGLVTLTDRPGGGARVTLHLPEAPPTPRATTTTAPALLSGGLALVVDDDDAMRKASRRMLASLGYDTVGASDGASAIEACAAASFVFVLLDLRMPGLSGLEVLLRLRATDPDVRVILYTGYARDETVRAALEPGRVGFLQKPFGRVDLEQQIQLVRR